MGMKQGLNFMYIEDNESSLMAKALKLKFWHSKCHFNKVPFVNPDKQWKKFFSRMGWMIYIVGSVGKLRYITIKIPNFCTNFPHQKTLSSNNAAISQRTHVKQKNILRKMNGFFI
jgi:hypothetical protein